MTQDEISELARKAGLFGTFVKYKNEIETLAKLVAEAEREACAEVCNKHANVYALMEKNPTAETAWAACIDNRDEIKARGQAEIERLKQRTWVGLTDEEIEQLHTAWVLGGGFRQLCNAIEAKLKEKNI